MSTEKFQEFLTEQAAEALAEEYKRAGEAIGKMQGAVASISTKSQKLRKLPPPTLVIGSLIEVGKANDDAKHKLAFYQGWTGAVRSVVLDAETMRVYDVGAGLLVVELISDKTGHVFVVHQIGIFLDLLQKWHDPESDTPNVFYETVRDWASRVDLNETDAALDQALRAIDE